MTPIRLRLSAFLVLLDLALSVAAAAADPLFAPPVFYSTGSGPFSVRSDRLDADPHYDIVVTNFYSNSVTVRLGTGTGALGSRVDYATGMGPWAAAIADLNGDGKNDLAVANYTVGTASVLLGAGDGTFGPKTDFDIGAGADGRPWSMEIRDMNADGRPDLVVANSGANSVTVLRQNDIGAFVPSNVLPAGITPTSAAAGDVNGDGAQDIVVTCYDSDAVLLFPGNGLGGFASPVTLMTIRRPLNVKIGDVNKDGIADVAVDGFGTGVAAVCYGLGSGTFLSPVLYPVGAGPYCIEIADLNGDSWPDLSLANSQSASVSVLINSGSSGFLPYLEYPAGSGAQSLAVRDFNEDGHLDLAVANFTASTAAILLNLAPTALDRPPIVTAPANVTGAAGSLIQFDVFASDPDGDFIVWLTASGSAMDAGGSFTAQPGNTQGTFSWTPTPAQANETYEVLLSATSACRPDPVSGVGVVCVTGTATTSIYVREPDRSPVVVAPSAVSGAVGALLSFVVSASDLDGQGIASLTASPLPTGAAFSSNPSHTSGTFSWTPGAGQTGAYTVVFTASNELTGTAATSILIGAGHAPPVLTAPASIATSEGSLVTFAVVATDPDGEHVTLGIQNRPVGATFVDQGNNTGAFNWTPSFSQGGSYAVTLTGVDASGATATPLTVAIEVDNVNRAPTASAGGPYSGVIAVPVTFNGTGSSDPDGDPLLYAWSFGDGGSGSGVAPTHAYGSGGTFVVALSVSDGLDLASGTTLAAIQDIFPARAFTTASNATIRLASGKVNWCAQIEPAGESYLNTSVVPSTITMSFRTASISAQPDKITIGGDKDGNGVEELAACFSKSDLRTLFAGLPRGTNTVTVVLEGDLATGGSFRANLTVDVVSNGGNLVASLSPNPLNPSGSLTFTTSRAGTVRVSVFDLQGRLVRTVLEEGALSAGYHDVRIDGLRDDGTRLASGVYFYRVEAAEGVAVGRVVVAR